MDPAETHEKIIGVLREKGPSLPINIAKALEISSLFISAFLSELTNQKRISVSSLKVGGSPLYYLDGQHDKLEDYYKYLHPREAEAYLLLKEHKVLRDKDQDPATRVALRSIKDFSVGFKTGDEIYWRYFSVSPEEIDGILNRTTKEEVVNEETEEPKIEVEKEPEPEAKVEIETQNLEKEPVEEEPISEKKVVVEEPAREVVLKPEITKDNDNRFNNPLVVNEVKKKKEKPRSEFVERVVSYISDRGLEIVEEKDYKNKEYNAIVRIKSELGPIDFFTQAKDKKTITEADFKKLLSTAQSIPLPAFLLYTGDVGKKAQDYLKEYGSVLKVKKINT